MCGVFGFVFFFIWKFFLQNPPMIEPRGVALLVMLGIITFFYIGAR